MQRIPRKKRRLLEMKIVRPNHPNSEEEELRIRLVLHNERAREYLSGDRYRLERIARRGHSDTTKRAQSITTAAAEAEIRAVQEQYEPVKDDSSRCLLRAYK